MLLTPGHSHRHLSSPSPSAISDASVQTPKSSTQITPRNPRGHPTVLDEDAYVASIEKIIERDFFPDISKLQDRLDWLEAKKTRDPVQIRDAQLKIIERQGKKVTHNPDPDGKTPGSSFTRSSFTPANEFDGRTPKTRGVSNMGLFGELESGGGDDGIDASLSLDQFFRRYTSEDNHSFSKILEKVFAPPRFGLEGFHTCSAVGLLHIPREYSLAWFVTGIVCSGLRVGRRDQENRRATSRSC